MTNFLLSFHRSRYAACIPDICALSQVFPFPHVSLPPCLPALQAYKTGPDARISEGNADFAITADFETEVRRNKRREAQRRVIFKFACDKAGLLV